jgi:hypothetical protein
MSNPYEPPSLSDLSLEDRIARLEAKYGEAHPMGFLEVVASVLAFVMIMAAGAMLFWIATKVGR